MAKRYFLPNELAGKFNWFLKFAQALPPYASRYGISAAEANALAAAHLWIEYWLKLHRATQAFAQSLTAFKTEAFFGTEDGAVSAMPVPPDFSTPPPAAPPGALPFALSLANRIKKHKDYTPADGEAMLLEGVEQEHDFSEVSPTLRMEVLTNAVRGRYKKMNAEGAEIWVKRGSGSWEFMQYARKVYFTDTQPFPTAEEKWQYKALFHARGERAGKWSEPVTVTVVAK